MHSGWNQLSSIFPTSHFRKYLAKFGRAIGHLHAKQDIGAGFDQETAPRTPLRAGLAAKAPITLEDTVLSKDSWLNGQQRIKE